MQFLLYGGGGSENQSVCDHHFPHALQHISSHRVDRVLLIVACGMLVHSTSMACVKLLNIGRNWNTLSYMPIQSIPNMLNGWQVWWVCWPFKNWDVSASRNCVQILATWGDGRGWMLNNGPQDLVTVSLCIQNAINKMHLCSLSKTYACLPSKMVKLNCLTLGEL